MSNRPVLWEKDSDKAQSTLRQPRILTLSSNSSSSLQQSAQWEKDSDKAQSTLRQPRILTLSSNSSSSLQQSAQSNSLELNNPNATVRSEPSPQNNDERDLKELVANSKLNVSANEWYPKNVCTNTTVYPSNPVDLATSRIQDRLKVHKGSTERVFDNNVNSEDSDGEYSPDLNRIKQIITTLTKDPGQFHNLLDLFMETLDPYLEDILATSLVAEIIVEQAINHPNFRYTGGRLCWCIEQHSPQFRAALHLKCKKQIEENPDTKNVLPLIAELYTQLPHLSVYGTLLIHAFKKLVEIGGNDNIKCICQALKLTGYSLEQSTKPELDNVFSDLRLVRGRVDGSAAILLESIFQLRSSNWGHSTEESSDSEQDNDISFEGLQGKVIYDIDGEALTSEESEFIASHLNANDEFEMDDFDPDELCDPEPEMDEEIQEAFKEFVRLSGKH